MNIKKIATLLIVGATALVVGMPVEASAETVVISVSNKTKIKALNTKLKKLPNLGAPYSTVKSLVTKLSKLDPKHASKYYKTGLKKLLQSPSQKTQASQLGKQVISIVKNSGLPTSQITKINKQVTQEEKKYPEPTPTPYQAFVPATEGYVIA